MTKQQQQKYDVYYEKIKWVLYLLGQQNRMFDVPFSLYGVKKKMPQNDEWQTHSHTNTHHHSHHAGKWYYVEWHIHILILDIIKSNSMTCDLNLKCHKRKRKQTN